MQQTQRGAHVCAVIPLDACAATQHIDEGADGGRCSEGMRLGQIWQVTPLLATGSCSYMRAQIANDFVNERHGI